MAVVVDHPVDDENATPIRRPNRDDAYGPMLAKRFPPYVFSIRGVSCLIHRVNRVEIHWWRIAGHGHLLAKLKKPVLCAHTVCGSFFRLEPSISRTCHVPNPDAIPCGRCNGEVPPFGRHGHATKAGLKAASRARSTRLCGEGVLMALKLPTLAEVEALRRGKPLTKGRPRALDKKDRTNLIVATDAQEDKKVKARSKGQCEIFVVSEGRCQKHGEGQPHHMLGGWGRRARGRSALAEHKQHTCGKHHREITGHILRLLPNGDLPRWDDAYERIR